MTRKPMKHLNLLIAFVLASIFGITSAMAATITVNTIEDELNSDGDCSFREAIMAVNTNTGVDQCTSNSPFGDDILNLKNLTGTIKVSGGELKIIEDLTIEGPGAEKLMLEGQNYSERLLVIDSPSDDQVLTLSGLTISRFGLQSNTLFGGAINVTAGEKLVADSMIFDDNQNLTGFGGVIGTDGGIVIVKNSTFSNNQGMQGGVIASQNGNITSHSNIYTKNKSEFATAIYSMVGSAGQVEVLNDKYTENVAKIGGGSLYNEDGKMNIENTTINNNDGGLFTAGVYNGVGKVIINKTTIDNNTASGATAILNYGDMSVTNSTISTNKALEGVAGIYHGENSLTIINSTIANNLSHTSGSSPVYKGGLYQEVTTAPVNLQNTIIYGNKAGANLQNDDCQATVISLGSNLIGNDQKCLGLDPMKDYVNIDPLLLPLAINAPGQTRTHGLPVQSPAIDKGTNVVDLVTDQRNIVRPQGTAFDIGAYEFNATPILTVVKPVTPNPTTDNTPDFTFKSNESGEITYSGNPSCSSSAKTIVANQELTVTFFDNVQNVSPGTYTCTIFVKDNGGEIGSLDVNFTIASSSSNSNNSSGGGGSGAGGPFAINNGSQSPFVGGGDTPDDYVGGDSDADPNSNVFTDIGNHWAKNEILTLAKDCNILGYQDSNGNYLHLFKPDQKITRAELLTMVVKCKFGTLNNPEKAPFPDVAANHWAAGSIKQALEKSIIQGYPDGTFKPNQFTIRAEALKMILLTWVNNEDIANAVLSESCKDVVQGEWYAKFFNFSLSKNIVGGYLNADGTPTGLCGPAKDITRAEAAKIIVKTKGL